MGTEAAVAYRRMEIKDIAAVNKVHVASFKDLEEREGIRNIGARYRVPDHFRMYLETHAARSFVAMSGEAVIGYCFGHQWGKTGWLGPLGTHPAFRRKRVGTELVFLALDALIGGGALTLGLESIPQSTANLSFYLRLGFRPLNLTVSLSRRVMSAGVTEETAMGVQVVDCAQLDETKRQRFIGDAARLVEGMCANLDVTPEIRAATAFDFGTTLYFVSESGLEAFAICHHRSYFLNADDSVLRVKALFFREGVSFGTVNAVFEYLDDYAWNMGLSYVQIGINSYHWMWLNHVLTLGFEIDIANLRMTYPGYDETIRAESPAFIRWVG